MECRDGVAELKLHLLAGVRLELLLLVLLRAEGPAQPRRKTSEFALIPFPSQPGQGETTSCAITAAQLMNINS